jgi:hypothetical protein
VARHNRVGVWDASRRHATQAARCRRNRGPVPIAIELFRLQAIRWPGTRSKRRTCRASGWSAEGAGVGADRISHHAAYRSVLQTCPHSKRDAIASNLSCSAQANAFGDLFGSDAVDQARLSWPPLSISSADIQTPRPTKRACGMVVAFDYLL